MAPDILFDQGPENPSLDGASDTETSILILAARIAGHQPMVLFNRAPPKGSVTGKGNVIITI